MAQSFDAKSVSEQAISGKDVEKLHAKIGQLVVERDFLGYFAICVDGLVSGHARHPPDVVV
jgi:hypothetical protein